MPQTVEAMVDEAGNVRLLKPLHLSSVRRALVTILDDARPVASAETPLRCDAGDGTITSNQIHGRPKSG